MHDPLRRTTKPTALMAVLVLLAAACSSDNGTSADELPDAVRQVMDEARYEHSTWGLLVTDIETGDAVYALNADQSFIPASTAKLYSMSSLLDAFGPDYRYETPVYAMGRVDGSALSGDLVLVASGDLVFGGRGATEGEIAYENFDHNDANALPGATLTPQDPLAALDELAGQVREAGVTAVDGDVIVDDRLFEIDTAMNEEAPTTPIMINENLIDLVITPTEPGQPAELSSRPQTATYAVTSTATTVAVGGTSNISISSPADGEILVSGTIAAGDQPLVRTHQIDDPAAFARTAFIEALDRAGVTVAAAATGPNPSGALPASGSYAEDAKLATYVSPPLSEYVRLVLKVSLNLGANLAVCLMAVERGSTECVDGFAQIREFLQKANIDPTDVSFTTGQGGKRSDLVTPNATVGVVTYWQGTDDFEVFKAALPVLGVDGSLSTVLPDSPAKGKVFAKTGTLVDGDDVSNRAQLGVKALGGYIETEDGRVLAFSLYVNNAALEQLPAGRLHHQQRPRHDRRDDPTGGVSGPYHRDRWALAHFRRGPPWACRGPKWWTAAMSARPSASGTVTSRRAKRGAISARSSACARLRVLAGGGWMGAGALTVDVVEPAACSGACVGRAGSFEQGRGVGVAVEGGSEQAGGVGVNAGERD